MMAFIFPQNTVIKTCALESDLEFPILSKMVRHIFMAQIKSSKMCKNEYAIFTEFVQGRQD